MNASEGRQTLPSESPALTKLLGLPEVFIYATILVSPLVVYRIDFMGVNLNLQRLFVVLALATWALRVLLTRKPSLPRSRALWLPIGAFALFTAYDILQLFYTRQPGYALSFVAGLIGGLVIMTAIGTILDNPRKLKLGLLAFVLSGAIPLGVGIYQSLGLTLGYTPTLPLKDVLSPDDLFLGTFRAFFYGEEVPRIPSTLAAPAFYGEFLTFVAIFLIVLIVCGKLTGLRALAAGVALGFTGFSVLATISRSAWILMTLGLFAVLFIVRRDLADSFRTRTSHWLVPVIAGSFFALVVITSFPLVTVVGASVESLTGWSIVKPSPEPSQNNDSSAVTENSTSRSAALHRELRKDAVGVFLQHPSLGVGLGNLGPAIGQEEGVSSAQAYGFTVLAEGGLLGISLLLLFMGSLLLLVRRTFLREGQNTGWRPYLMWLYISLGLLVFNNLLLYDTLFRDTSWALMGLCLAAAGSFVKKD